MLLWRNLSWRSVLKWKVYFFHMPYMVVQHTICYQITVGTNLFDNKNCSAWELCNWFFDLFSVHKMMVMMSQSRSVISGICQGWQATYLSVKSNSPRTWKSWQYIVHALLFSWYVHVSLNAFQLLLDDFTSTYNYYIFI